MLCNDVMLLIKRMLVFLYIRPDPVERCNPMA